MRVAGIDSYIYYLGKEFNSVYNRGASGYHCEKCIT
jgi:hypothetical protein